METGKRTTITRRDALKTLAAITGAVSLASLPSNWETPLVEAGALPAHAQNSVELTVEQMMVSHNNNTIDGQAIVKLPTSNSEATAWILDLAGKFDPNNDPVSIYAKVDGCGEMVYGKEWAALGSDVTLYNWSSHNSTIAGAVNGSLWIGFNINSTACDPTGKKFCMAISHGGRTSPQYCATIVNVSS